MTQVSYEKINNAQVAMKEQQALVQTLLERSRDVSNYAEQMLDQVSKITQSSLQADHLTKEGEERIHEVVCQIEQISNRSQSIQDRMKI